MRSLTVDIDGPVHYVEYDGPADGPLWVLVHGLGGSHLNWHSLAPLLARHGRVLALDLAGFGRTPLAGRSASVRANRALLDRFIEEVAGPPVVLVGNSMGGVISALQAATRPESVAGLVLIDPALPGALGRSVDPVVAGAFAAYMIPGVGERLVQRRVATLGPEGVADETIRMCTVDPTRVDAELVALQRSFSRERFETMPWASSAFLEAARSLVRLLARRRFLYDAVRAISAPTLVIMGRADRLVPLAAAQAVAKLRRDFELVVFDDVGHVPMMEAPHETFAAIEAWMGPHARLLRRAGQPARGSEAGDA